MVTLAARISMINAMPLEITVSNNTLSLVEDDVTHGASRPTIESDDLQKPDISSCNFVTKWSIIGDCVTKLKVTENKAFFFSRMVNIKYLLF